MRAVGIIAEFDPFHDGHAYLLREAKRVTGAGYVVVAMSGDFVQRGEPAVFDKYERARSAVMGGADVVFEIPTAYATSGARIFSEAGIRLLDSTGVVDSVCFGSECGDMEKLYEAADLLDNESEEFKERLAEFQKAGDSYPKAREKALIETGASEELVTLMKEPNNILGIHYISAIRNSGSALKAYTVKRIGAGYHDQSTGSEGFESATGIRNKILNEGLTNYGRFPLCADDFSQILFSKLLETTPEQLALTADVDESFARAVLKYKEKSMSFGSLVKEIKSKNNLYTQVCRALMHIILGVKEEVRGSLGNLRIPYLRLLAFKESSSSLIREMREPADAPIITKPADAPCRDDELFRLDIKAASLYNGAVFSKYGAVLEEDMKRRPEMVRL
ncbi:MAG: nucleotidyltransferase family protein [Lachnospiraceae bacterium]|nr:nucleotidyltransferase family protein [Lachnospiraceae bacterium]